MSKKKRRFQLGGYDLDLTYVTPRIIAMGYPSDGYEAFYRNPAAEVADFLKKYHGEHVWVFNLCSERSYDRELFGGRVSHYPFDDHRYTFTKKKSSNSKVITRPSSSCSSFVRVSNPKLSEIGFIFEKIAVPEYPFLLAEFQI